MPADVPCAQLFYLPLVVLALGAVGGGALGLPADMLAGGVSLVAGAMCIASIGCLSHQSTARTGERLPSPLSGRGANVRGAREV